MFRILILVSVAFAVVFSNTDSVNISDSFTNACTPEIDFIYDNRSQSFCLNNLQIDDSSCVKLGITLKKTYNVTVHCSKKNDSKWQFDSISQAGNNGQSDNIRMTIQNSETGFFQKLILFAGEIKDSNSVNLMIKHQFDLPENKKDTTPVLDDFIISKTTLPCEKPPQQYKVYYDYKMDYSAGYVRREQILNYPELSMFHYGGSVKMPTSNEVWERGMELVEYHLLHASEPKTDFDKTCTGPVRYVPPPKEKVERKHFFTIKPIR